MGGRVYIIAALGGCMLVAGVYLICAGIGTTSEVKVRGSHSTRDEDGFELQDVDFGEAGSGAEIEVELIVRNNSAKRVFVESVIPGCGCVVVGFRPQSVAGWKSLAIPVTVRLPVTTSSVPFEKLVWISYRNYENVSRLRTQLITGLVGVNN